jgi:hypothetical protein
VEQAVKTDCPDTTPNCPGNPEMNNPLVAYSEKHHDLLRQHKMFNAIGIAGLVAGGALTATGIVLFIVDKPSKKERRRKASLRERLVVSPVVDGRFAGVAGRLTF